MIKTVNLQKIFKTEEVETWALNNVNLEIKAGEFVAIMGPSGCGKSTLLNILGLLDNPTGGTYELNGTDVSKFTEAQRTNLRKGVIGFVFQSFNLIDELNVYGDSGGRTQTPGRRCHEPYGYCPSGKTFPTTTIRRTATTCCNSPCCSSKPETDSSR